MKTSPRALLWALPAAAGLALASHRASRTLDPPPVQRPSVFPGAPHEPIHPYYDDPSTEDRVLVRSYSERYSTAAPREALFADSAQDRMLLQSSPQIFASTSPADTQAQPTLGLQAFPGQTATQNSQNHPQVIVVVVHDDPREGGGPREQKHLGPSPFERREEPLRAGPQGGGGMQGGSGPGRGRRAGGRHGRGSRR